MRSATLGLLLVCGLAQSARAADPPRYRFHVVRDSLVNKLTPGAQRAEKAVVAFPKATGFVVGADPARPQRILIMTNYHVAGEGPPAGDVKFRDGTTATPLRTVVSNPKLDYALVEAELTSGPRSNGVEPLTIDRSPTAMSPGFKIYAIGGHTGLGTGVSPQGKTRELANTDPRRSIAGGAAVEKSIVDAIAADDAAGTGPTGFRTIAVGKVLNSSTHAIRVSVGDHKKTLGIESDMPNSPGMSGAPVLDRYSHKVVGLHFSGFGPAAAEWTESSAPMSLVMRDITAKLKRGQTNGQTDLVQRLVDGN